MLEGVRKCPKSGSRRPDVIRRRRCWDVRRGDHRVDTVSVKPTEARDRGWSQASRFPWRDESGTPRTILIRRPIDPIRRGERAHTPLLQEFGYTTDPSGNLWFLRLGTERASQPLEWFGWCRILGIELACLRAHRGPANLSDTRCTGSRCSMDSPCQLLRRLASRRMCGLGRWVSVCVDFNHARSG